MNNKLQLTSHVPRATNHESRKRVGSALILTVVLMTLLAIIGVIFLLASRIDKMAASAASQSRELNLAVDTVVAKIKQELVLDVPGVAGQEYYDYPGPEDRWLASLEPCQVAANNYRWPQISDVYNKLVSNLQLQAAIVPDYQDAKIVGEGQIADADGDGVADSRWVVIPDVNSSKGRPIYAAIRIIDNGGMLNVNTAYKFDPNDPKATVFDIDGSSQRQINLAALSQRGANGTLAQAAGKLQAWRCGTEPTDLSLYEQNVVWRYNNPMGAYTPFDIGDELELRNRFLINLPGIDSRIENVWTNAFKNLDLRTPVPWDNSPTMREANLKDWFYRAQHDLMGLNDIYSYRHIGTTCNMDRIITPPARGFGPLPKMVNVNTASAKELSDALVRTIDSSLAAQLAVNIVDLRDNDVNVTVLGPPVVPKTYYGFEAQPFISEIAFRISGTNPDNPANNYFAIELYNPFEVPIPLGDFRIELRLLGGNVLKVNLAGYAIPVNGRFVITNGGDPNLVLAKYTQTSPPPNVNYTAERYDIYLLRRTPAQDIYLDKQGTQDAWFNWNSIKDVGQFYYRHDRNWNVVYQNMDPNSIGTLGTSNGGAGRTNYNIPTFRGGFVTVGDIARVLTVGPSPNPNDMIGVRLASQPPENNVRINLADAAFQQIFNYLTVFDPAVYPWNDPNETKVKGRININTAPWFVIAQLPWMQPRIAQTIVAYRDKLELVPNVVDYSGGRGRGMVDLDPSAPFPPALVREELGFASVAELLSVTHDLANKGRRSYDYRYDIRMYGRDKDPTGNSIDQMGFPDLTTDPPRTGVDGAANDFEERDLIFSRISNLVTVRSDVFTAYMLVRIGVNGPQRRVIAILDRSNVYSQNDKVKIIALQPVPDPR